MASTADAPGPRFVRSVRTTASTTLRPRAHCLLHLAQRFGAGHCPAFPLAEVPEEPEVATKPTATSPQAAPPMSGGVVRRPFVDVDMAGALGNLVTRGDRRPPGRPRR
jgi:hypothetical protein